MDEKLRNIIRGCRLNDQIFLLVLSKARRGDFKTERDISRFIKSELRRAGAGLAFQPIVAIGKNAVDWHHRPANSSLVNGGFCVIDFGARFSRYCSDMTRTVYFGKASRKEKSVYAKVLRANLLCTKKIRPGANGHEIYLHAKKILGAHAKYFGHSLGHGLKKIIHASQRLSKKKGHYLAAGDVITIEPGVYVPGKFGIRIEDDILITKKGFRVLSASTHKLAEIRIWP